MSMYGKNHYNIVISLQLIKINEKKEEIVKKLSVIGKNLLYSLPKWKWKWLSSVRLFATQARFSRQERLHG